MHVHDRYEKKSRFIFNYIAKCQEKMQRPTVQCKGETKGIFRQTMEDRMIVGELVYGNNFLLYAVLDGHGGSEAAIFFQKRIPELLREVKTGIIYQDICKALLDADIEWYKNHKNNRSGTTFTGVLVFKTRIFTINIGDSRTLLKLHNGSIAATVDHNAKNAFEVKSIQDDGGIIRDGRLFGTLAVLRALGDNEFKQAGMKQKNNPYIYLSGRPQIVMYDRAAVSSIVIACDGLYDTNWTNDAIFDKIDTYGCQTVINRASEISKDNVSMIYLTNVSPPPYDVVAAAAIKRPRLGDVVPVAVAADTVKIGPYTFPAEINNHGTGSSCKISNCRMCQAKNLINQANNTRLFAAQNGAQRRMNENTALELINDAYNLVGLPQDRPKAVIHAGGGGEREKSAEFTNRYGLSFPGDIDEHGRLKHNDPNCKKCQAKNKLLEADRRGTWAIRGTVEEHSRETNLAQSSLAREAFEILHRPAIAIPPPSYIKMFGYEFPAEINQHGRNIKCTAQNCRMCEAKKLYDEAIRLQTNAGTQAVQEKNHQEARGLAQQAYQLLNNRPTMAATAGGIIPKADGYPQCRRLYGDKSICFYDADKPYYEFTNFYPSRVTIDGKEWSTTEHYYQAMKFENFGRQTAIGLLSARGARDFAQQHNSEVRKGWHNRQDNRRPMKVNVMKKALMEKFKAGSSLRNLLDSTKGYTLVEHTSNDNYWGDGGGPPNTGKNVLGHLLMEIRDNLQLDFFYF